MTLVDGRRLVRVHGDVSALAGVDLVVEGGEAVGVIGPSGSGKSTLLSLVAGLQAPTAGSLIVAGTDVATASGRALARLRAASVGVVLQTPGRNLLPYATALENVVFAQRPGRPGRRQARRTAAELLEAVGLAHLAGRRAGGLSGGEQQRVAVAAGLAHRPVLLVADEPTSQLDEATAAEVADLLLSACRTRGAALLVATHDPSVAARLDRSITLRDGRAVGG